MRRKARPMGTIHCETPVSFDFTSKVDPSRSEAFRRIKHIFAPRRELELPNSFTVQLDAISTTGGVRGFRPAQECFLLNAALGGQAILEAKGDFSNKTIRRHKVLHLLFQHATLTREFLSRAFRTRLDLLVSRKGRSGADDQPHVLPETLGLSGGSTGVPWNVDDLMKRGRHAASAAGCVRPDSEAVIRYGLLEAARLAPAVLSDLSPHEARTNLRLALFDFGPAECVPDKATRNLCFERLADALLQHRDDSPDAFREWWFEHRDNVIHQIAKKTGRGGSIANAVVRSALISLVFDSMAHVARCVDLQMREFAAALPRPLSRLERRLFSAVYLRQRFLGGFPLLLLEAQFQHLREAFLWLMEDPADAKRQGVFLRVIEFRGDMVRKRRGADRVRKTKSSRQPPTVNVGRTSLPHEASLEDVFAKLRERRGHTCECMTTASWSARIERQSDVDVTVHDECSVCRRVESFTVQIAELQRMMAEKMER